MVSTETPLCNFGWKASDFSLKDFDGKTYTLADVKGPKGTLIIFICNHCPYVKAILDRLVRDVKAIQAEGIGVIAIMPNDPTDYPEDSVENMKAVAARNGFTFPYVIDDTQDVARAYGAVCTPDFFGFNSDLELQYRGRLDASRLEAAPIEAERELLSAMMLIAKTGQGPKAQIASMGCSIKWSNE
ncbi:MAG: thioredoxin family protein [Rhodospirillales bacterium]|nr:thioredoxin family protein [Rhodospirillales bacterium]